MRLTVTMFPGLGDGPEKVSFVDIEIGVRPFDAEEFAMLVEGKVAKKLEAMPLAISDLAIFKTFDGVVYFATHPDDGDDTFIHHLVVAGPISPSEVDQVNNLIKSLSFLSSNSNSDNAFYYTAKVMDLLRQLGIVRTLPVHKVAN